jgi:hypothetical protein
VYRGKLNEVFRIRNLGTACRKAADKIASSVMQEAYSVNLSSREVLTQHSGNYVDVSSHE